MCVRARVCALLFYPKIYSQALAVSGRGQKQQARGRCSKKKTQGDYSEEPPQSSWRLDSWPQVNQLERITWLPRLCWVWPGLSASLHSPAPPPPSGFPASVGQDSHQFSLMPGFLSHLVSCMITSFLGWPSRIYISPGLPAKLHVQLIKQSLSDSTSLPWINPFSCFNLEGCLDMSAFHVLSCAVP